jgi:putative transcriptional regulator
MSPKSTRVTNRIRELRAEVGDMSQAELGALVGVTRQTIIAVEQGGYSPSLETAFRIARALGHPLDDVFSFPAEED